MATLLEKKNGGPYTKKEQETRRDKVYRLHFEKGYSAVKIAKRISVSRNTINGDIKYLYAQISNEFKNNNLLGFWALRQYDRLENQRGRLLTDLEKQDKLKDKILVERMILDVDSKISDLIQKINPFINDEPGKNEKQIRDIVRKIILNPIFSSRLKRDEIIFEIIDIIKCSISKATKIFEEMRELGLGLNENNEDQLDGKYDLVLFSELREYLNKNELEKVYERIQKNNQLIKIGRDSQKKFEMQYGSDRSEWPKEVLEEIRKELDVTI